MEGFHYPASVRTRSLVHFLRDISSLGFAFLLLYRELSLSLNTTALTIFSSPPSNITMSSTMTTSIVASEKDPRTTDEFKTYAVDGGKDLSAYIFYSKLNAQGVKPTEKDLPHLSGEFADPRRVVIRDARGQDQLKLDDCGFEYFSQPVPEADYADDNSIRQIY
jgi:hypothetical protein